MMALMAFGATTAFAQDALVKEAKKHLSKSDYATAVQTLAPALTSSETLDKAAAWNLQSNINYDWFIAIQTEEAKNQLEKKQVPFDTLSMYRAAVAAWDAALKCDELDMQPNEKGKVKPRFRSASINRFKTHGIALVQAGQFQYNKKNLDEAMHAWEAYVNMSKAPMFAEVKDFPRESFYYDITYYVALLAYQKKDFVLAEKYARLTAEDPSKEEQANEILLFSQKENCKTKEDTLAYIARVKELHKQKPEEERYFNLLMDYYTHANDMVAMEAWADEEVTLNDQNKMAWALKGYAIMQQEKWDDAIAAFKKAVEIDPDYIEGNFNIGACLNSKARTLQDELADKKTGTISKANLEKVKAVLLESKGYMEKAKELDPYQEKAKWAYPLYQVYYTLGDQEKAAEMEKLVNQ